MVPMMTSASPTLTVRSQKPAFSFNMQNSRGSNLFTNGRAAVVGLDAQDQQMDASWDIMGDDVSDGARSENQDEDDSRDLTFPDDEQDETMPYSPGAPSADNLHLEYPEVEAFAMQLDSSNLLQSRDPNSPQAVQTGYELIGRFKEVSGSLLEEVLSSTQEMSAEQRSESEYWQLEHQTWELFGTLSSHRLDGDLESQEMPLELSRNRYTSNQRLHQYLFETSSKFKEWSLILQWLWEYAPDPSAILLDEDNLKGGNGWMYTKESLKQEKRLKGRRGKTPLAFSSGRSKDKVTELDPDAPTRQQKRLEEEDEESEKNLFRAIWVFLRKGDFAGARAMCSDLGEWWIGATLRGVDDGWDSLIDGQRYDPEEDEGEDMGMDESGVHAEGVTGNRRRELWKRMCYAIAHRPGAEDWERAVYGVLCGDLESVISVCQSWEDHLFAHMNSLVEEYYTQYLLQNSRIPPATLKFPTFDSTAFHSRTGSLSDDDTVLPRIMDSLASLEFLKSESTMPLRIIQGSLISLRFDGLVEELNGQLQRFAEDPGYDPVSEGGRFGLDVSDCRMLRVVVHILLILQSLNAGFTPETPHHEAAEGLIAAYIEFLVEINKHELVPLYAGRLSPRKSIQVMGTVLRKITQDAKRLELLKLMKMHNIDYVGCLKRGMELSLELTEGVYAKETRAVISLSTPEEEIQEEDELLIQGLEWLVLGGEELRAEAVKKSTVVYKRLLLCGRLAAARRVFQIVRSADLVPEGGEVNGFTGIIEEPVDGFTGPFEARVDRWALCVLIELEVFIKALDAWEEWKDLLEQRPEHLDREFKASLLAAYEVVNLKLLEAVKSWLEDSLNTAPSKLPDSPEVVDTPSLVALRNMYIPELTFVLHDVYIKSGKWLGKGILSNTLELSALVADHRGAVLKCFSETGRVEEYVRALALASRIMLGSPSEKRKGMLEIWSVR